MDISRFDFELDEIVGLIPRLAGLAQIIELEPRLHEGDEEKSVHSLRSEPTFRLSCQLAGSDQTVSRLADLAVETGVEAVLDFGRSVRFRHIRPNEIAPPEPEVERSSSPEEESPDAAEAAGQPEAGEAAGSFGFEEASPAIRDGDTSTEAEAPPPVGDHW
ncbi:MAG: hypothetical protein ABSD97_07565 [Acidimicrobiales bacterium]|jgi:hypothetical protein